MSSVRGAFKALLRVRYMDPIDPRRHPDGFEACEITLLAQAGAASLTVDREFIDFANCGVAASQTQTLQLRNNSDEVTHTPYPQTSAYTF